MTNFDKGTMRGSPQEFLLQDCQEKNLFRRIRKHKI